MKILTSSVIRSSMKGEIHGGLYIVDLETENTRQVLKRDNIDINWSGRGGERGLRGIEFYDGKVILTDHDKIMIYNQNFELIEEYKNQYFDGCHEISRRGRQLFVTSTEFNSILIFDLETKKFEVGYHVQSDPVTLLNFNPSYSFGPIKKDVDHINNVHATKNTWFFSALGNDKIWSVNSDSVGIYCKIEKQTHNAQPYKEGTVYVNTLKKQVCYKPNLKKEKIFRVNIPGYSEEQMKNTDLPEKVAQEKWGRGLSILDKKRDIIAAGSSPATVTVYDMKSESVIKNIPLSYDKRNAIHGFEVWPYS